MSGCFECGEPAQHQHHVVPRSKGGTRTVPLCEKCHGLVHNRQMNTSALTREALAARRAAGRRVGPVPHGYSDDGTGRLVENAVERQYIAEMVSCHRASLTLRDISDHLTDKGFTNRFGRPFNPSSVRNILMNEGVYGRR